MLLLGVTREASLNNRGMKIMSCTNSNIERGYIFKLGEEALLRHSHVHGPLEAFYMEFLEGYIGEYEILNYFYLRSYRNPLKKGCPRDRVQGG